MLHRVLCSSAFVLFAAATVAQPLPGDGNVVPPHPGASSEQGQGDTPPAPPSPPSPYVDEGNGGGNSSLPSDGNIVPPHTGGGSDDSAGDDAPTGPGTSSGAGTSSSSGSQLPNDGNVVPHGESEPSQQPQTPAGDDKSI